MRTTIATILLLLSACDNAVALCIAQGGNPDACAAQWSGDPLVCEPVVQPDSTTCCAPGTGTPEQPQCDEND